jgi:hypothetical protein
LSCFAVRKNLNLDLPVYTITLENRLIKKNRQMENREATLLKRQKHLHVVIVILLLTNLGFFMYGFVQQGIAGENARLAAELHEKLKSTEEEAQRQADLAAKMAIEANARLQAAIVKQNK